ncbi:arabinan endo-1,5-alpha-L-arabinosidase [Kineothrix alysoides]|uniref:Arabinan endo-1,5-alpha-L-arabinosidase n=1 Tax=Kineothrix alysoides TaxID=1469948 RepID=A0A4V2QB28_9FIRM|nr:glycoside hydrolase family 43 protein [Kineothrix alysoides]TCL54782.1 arabinan endo-1,5-alpha-L-arabinosidase [Kineothrix alysoides]
MKHGKKLVSIMLLAALTAGCGQAEENFDNIPLTSAKGTNIFFKNVSVHDPSVVKYDGTYYIFGSHLAAAKSDNLMDWTLIGSGVTKGNPIIPDAKNEMPEALEWAQTDTFWAPDVIQLGDGKFYMYYCNCEGSSPLSCLGLAVSNNIEGPYKDLGIFLKSGMVSEPSENGDTYDATRQPNVVDPCVFYDAEGKLWMVYGSYSGGIFILELDKNTGLPIETGYGKQLLGGNHLRIEGAYIQYNPETEYYYMFLSFGGLAADGAYNIRVCRSKTPDGPYCDSQGQDMIECAGPDGSFFDDREAELYGVKLMGNYKWAWHEGENGEKRKGIVSPGHNSTIYDEESGKYFIIFHTRFESKGENHEVRVHQMFFNEEGWPVIAPYRYAGETTGKFEKKEAAGIYKVIKHGRQITTQMKESVDITLHFDGTVTGAYEGSWELSDGNQLKIMLGEESYDGVLCKQYDEFGEKYVIGFTVLSEDGVAVWGSGLAAVEE